MDAGSIEAVGIELDRMKCSVCMHEELCDDTQIRYEWNERFSDSAIPRKSWHVLPSVRFDALWSALGARGHGGAVFARLRTAYDEPHRAYHTARHIGACLRLLDDPAVRELAAHPVEIEAALWFHDAVYDTHASDNEEQSAQLLEQSLASAGVAADVVARSAAHVRATKDHATDSDDGRLLVDIDLSILGEPPEVFARFEEEIRDEYEWVDDALYRAGRAAVLRRFVERPTIYGTPLLRDRFEAQARANIAASLRALTPPSTPS